MVQVCRSSQRGLSLIELVVGSAIVATLVRFAVPAAQDLLLSVGLASASSELVADLVLARAEALKRNRRVALCKSSDGEHCAQAGGWEQGWIVFHDENANGRPDEGEERIARHGALPWHLHLTGNQPVARYISYTATGASKLTGGGFQAGTLTLCQRSADRTPSRRIILNALGRPRVQKATVDMCGG